MNGEWDLRCGEEIWVRISKEKDELYEREN